MTTLFCCSSPAATHKRLPALAAPLILHPSVADRSPGLSLIFSGAFNPLPPATTIRRPPLVVKASRKNQNYSSIVCPDCNGNGAILCTQCKGNGVNSVDHFNGQFKAGALCWLCSEQEYDNVGNLLVMTLMHICPALWPILFPWSLVTL